MILEEILAQVGNTGRFQKLFSLVILSMEVVIAWSMLQTALVGATPKWWCVDSDNATFDNFTFQTCSSSFASSPPSSSPSPLQQSNSSEVKGNLSDVTQDIASLTSTVSSSPKRCVRHYDPNFVTFVSEWDLVCERQYIKTVINSVQMAGVLVGSVISGQSSDSVGRRFTCYFTMALHSLTCFLAGFSSTWQMYTVFRFLVGTACGSYMVMHYVYVIEFVSPNWRPYLASVPIWAISAGFMCLTAWQLPNWRYLHYICASLSVLTLLGWFISPESVRWLATKGKVEEAEQVVDRIAKMNGRTKSPDTTEQLSLLAEEEKSHTGDKNMYTYLALVKGYKNIIKTLILAFCWSSLSMSFYGIIFGVSALSGNVFLNMFLLSVLEVPVTLGTSILVIYLGRRWTSSIYFFLSSLAGFGILIADRTALVDSRDIIVNIVAICSKVLIAGAWTAMQTYTAELYPTVIRSLGVGAAYTAARVGGILAPFILEMDSPDDAVRCYVIVGGIMAVSGLSVLILKDTKGKPLADTIHQAQKDIDL